MVPAELHQLFHPGVACGFCGHVDELDPKTAVQHTGSARIRRTCLLYPNVHKNHRNDTNSIQEAGIFGSSG